MLLFAYATNVTRAAIISAHRIVIFTNALRRYRFRRSSYLRLNVLLFRGKTRRERFDGFRARGGGLDGTGGNAGVCGIVSPAPLLEKRILLGKFRDTSKKIGSTDRL